MKVVRLPKQKILDSLVGTPMPERRTRSGKFDKLLFARWMIANPTPAEQLFLETWVKVTHIVIKPQAVILGFIADFYIKHKKLIIEVDGSSHNKRKDYDQNRDRIFRENGYHTIRLTNKDVLADPIRLVSDLLVVIDGLERLKPISKPKVKKAGKPSSPKWTRVPKLTKDHLPARKRKA